MIPTAVWHCKNCGREQETLISSAAPERHRECPDCRFPRRRERIRHR